MTDLLTQKNTKRENFQPPKNMSDPPLIVYTSSTGTPWGMSPPHSKDDSPPDRVEGLVLDTLIYIIIKFRYNARSDWLEQRALSEYGCTE